MARILACIPLINHDCHSVQLGGTYLADFVHVRRCPQGAESAAPQLQCRRLRNHDRVPPGHGTALSAQPRLGGRPPRESIYCGTPKNPCCLKDESRYHPTIARA